MSDFDLYDGQNCPCGNDPACHVCGSGAAFEANRQEREHNERAYEAHLVETYEAHLVEMFEAHLAEDLLYPDTSVQTRDDINKRIKDTP